MCKGEATKKEMLKFILTFLEKDFILPFGKYFLGIQINHKPNFFTILSPRFSQKYGQILEIFLWEEGTICDQWPNTDKLRQKGLTFTFYLLKCPLRCCGSWVDFSHWILHQKGGCSDVQPPIQPDAIAGSLSATCADAVNASNGVHIHPTWSHACSTSGPSYFCVRVEFRTFLRACWWSD